MTATTGERGESRCDTQGGGATAVQGMVMDDGGGGGGGEIPRGALDSIVARTTFS